MSVLIRKKRISLWIKKPWTI